MATPHSLQNLTLIFLTILVAFSSCEDKEVKPTTLERLNSSTWIGITETTQIEVALNGEVKSESTEIGAEDEYRRITFNQDNTVAVKYQCTVAACNGDEYVGLWSLINDELTVTLNGEQFNSIGDVTLIGAKIAKINATEMILETINPGHTPGKTRIINRMKFIRK